MRTLIVEDEAGGRNGVKVIMTTALDDPKTVIKAYNEMGAMAYMVKPVSKKRASP